MLSEGLVVHEEVHHITILGILLEPAHILVCGDLILGEAECYVVGEGVVAEKELQAGLGSSGVHEVGALPSHDVTGTFREHGLVTHLIDNLSDGVVIDKLRVTEDGGLHAEEFLYLGGVLCHLMLELGVGAK